MNKIRKILYCIRHGYALHNQLYKHMGSRAYYEYRDTPLLHQGIEQAKNLNKIWNIKKDIELVVVSPSVRTLDTSLFIFKDVNVPIVAVDFLLEYPLGAQICNRRKDISDLKVLYPMINFNNIQENEFPWSETEETVGLLNGRISYMKDWLAKRHDKKIAILGHSS